MKKHVLITGANSGIGYYLTLSLLKKNYRVAVLDITVEEISRWEKTFGEALLVYKCDVSDQEQVDDTIQNVYRSFGRIDIVVNNACRAAFNSFENSSMEEIRSVFHVNVFGMLHVIKAVLPEMIKRKEGIIHNVGSGVGITGFKNLLGYSASKGAVETLTKCLALEYRDSNIVFNIIHPPLTATPSAQPLGLPPEMMEDPEKVGMALSKKIESRRKIITSDWKSSLGIHLMKLFPYFMGNMFSELTYKKQKQA
jgi:NAD(P)-dependent dehydrogenase (short-subunit alcohol dehydrogenase family)